MRKKHSVLLKTRSYIWHQKIARGVYSRLSLSRTCKGLGNLFEIESVRDREIKIGYSLDKGTETLVRDREKFEIEGVRDIVESLLYYVNKISTLEAKRSFIEVKITFI